MTVVDAAEQLGVSASRVRALARSGELTAERFGDRWLIDRVGVEQQQGRVRRPGRPFEPDAAWALLAVADGREPQWVDRVQRRRIDNALNRHSIDRLVGKLRRRATKQRWYVHPSLLLDLLDGPSVVRTGPAATSDLASDRGPAEIYVDAESAGRLQQRVRPLTSGLEFNLVVHVVGGRWPFEPADRRAWDSVIAVDLLDEHAADPRCREVATRLARGSGFISPQDG